MNQQDEDKILHDLYQQANHKKQPPQALDDLILKHARQSSNTTNDVSTVSTSTNWRPWMAAASVVLVIPMIWLLTQNQQLQPEISTLPESENRAKAVKKSAPASSDFADDAGIEAESVSDSAWIDQDKEQKQDKITTTGSRISRSEPASPAPLAMPDLQEMIEQQGQQSITGKPIDQDSLQANKVLLKSELKPKKRTIKPSTMDPLMLLEYEQFGRYLEQGEIDAADQLLTEMQETWPDFDFEDMIYRLAATEANN